MRGLSRTRLRRVVKIGIWIPAPRFREDKLRGNDSYEMACSKMSEEFSLPLRIILTIMFFQRRESLALVDAVSETLF
jgi:hypothetical protein